MADPSCTHQDALEARPTPSPILFTHPFADLGKSFRSQPTFSSFGPIPHTPPDYTFTFSDETLQELNAQFSTALSPSTQLESVKVMSALLAKGKDEDLVIPEPLISLYYPRKGCHDIIDAAVKQVAQEQSADVMVIDALHFVMQEYGPLGKDVSDAISVLYGPTQSSEEGKRNGDRAQSAFDSLVNTIQEPSTFDDSTEGNTAKGKRIIYIRGFDTIAPVAERIVLRLLRALHARRIARFAKREETDSSLPTDAISTIQPTVLVLGYSIPTSTSSCSCDSCQSGSSSEFIKSGPHIREKLPSTGNSITKVDDSSYKLSSHVSDFSASFFLASLADSGSTHTSDVSHDEQFTLSKLDPRSAPSYLSVFAQTIVGAETSEAEAHMERARREEIASAWLQISLAFRSATLVDDPPNSTNDEQSQDATPEAKEDPSTSSDDSKGLDALQTAAGSGLKMLHELDNIAKIAIGMSDHSDPQSPVRVTRSTLSSAYRLAFTGKDQRKEWISPSPKPTEESNTSEEDSKKDEETKEEEEPKEEEDEIITKVKQSDDLSSKEKKLLGCIVGKAEINTSFEDVCVSPAIVESLRNIISLPLLYPQAFKSGILGKESTGGVLLYGPPGTGKTHLCRAVARECGARMLYVKPSDILDCYVGESEKLINGLFSLAHRLAPCLIFIDEVDSCFRQRKETDRKWERDMLSEFLQCMDGLRSSRKNKEAGIMVIGATNRPQDIDPAVLRRLSNRVMMDLPTESEREKILKIYLDKEPLDEGVKLSDIARMLRNYSGSDIKNLCVSAAMQSVKDSIGEISWSIPKADKPDAASDSSSETPADGEKPDSPPKDPILAKIEQRKITQSNLLNAMQEVPPSTTSDSHGEMHRWDSQFGKKQGKNASRPSTTTSNWNNGTSYSGGYTAPTNGYNASNGRYTAPTNGYSASNGGYTPPTGGYNASNGEYTPSTGGYNASNSGYTPPTGGYNAAGGGHNLTGGFNKGNINGGSYTGSSYTGGVGSLDGKSNGDTPSYLLPISSRPKPQGPPVPPVNA